MGDYWLLCVLLPLTNRWSGYWLLGVVGRLCTADDTDITDTTDPTDSRWVIIGFCSAKVHSTAGCAVSRDKDDLMRLAVGVRIVRIVRNVRTGGYGGQRPL